MVKVSRVKWMPWQCQRVKGMTFDLKVTRTGSGRHIHRWKTAHSILHWNNVECAEQEGCV